MTIFNNPHCVHVNECVHSYLNLINSTLVNLWQVSKMFYNSPIRQMQLECFGQLQFQQINFYVPHNKLLKTISFLLLKWKLHSYNLQCLFVFRPQSCQTNRIMRLIKISPIVRCNTWNDKFSCITAC